MSTIVVIAIIAAALVLGVFLFVALRRYLAERNRRRERLAADAAGHRQEADANAAIAERLNQQAERLRTGAEQHRGEAERHRIEAERHAELAERHAAEAEEESVEAEQAKERIERAGRSADMHDQHATELERKL
jgi:hypothetical protein